MESTSEKVFIALHLLCFLKASKFQQLTFFWSPVMWTVNSWWMKIDNNKDNGKKNLSIFLLPCLEYTDFFSSRVESTLQNDESVWWFVCQSAGWIIHNSILGLQTIEERYWQIENRGEIIEIPLKTVPKLLLRQTLSFHSYLIIYKFQKGSLHLGNTRQNLL